MIFGIVKDLVFGFFDWRNIVFVRELFDFLMLYDKYGWLQKYCVEKLNYSELVREIMLFIIVGFIFWVFKDYLVWENRE